MIIIIEIFDVVGDNDVFIVFNSVPAIYIIEIFVPLHIECRII